MSQPAFDFGDEVDDAENPTYTVAELGDAINDTLRRGFRDGVWVRGEISGWSDRGNHAYFTLADDSADAKAVVNVQFFAPARMRLRPMLQKHRLRLADGMKVRIFGFLDFYTPGGRLGLKMTGIDPRYTLGDIAQSRDAVMRRLVAEGLLDLNGRRQLSPLPLRVGVVTSLGTAAWHDFRDELDSSGFGFQVYVADVRVQGAVAAPMVAAAITALARAPALDAIVVIRGGGARNELAVFDAEEIARAIAGAPTPVLTGLGHEVDRSIADETAHTAAKTPTACARILIDRVSATCAGAETTWAAIERRAGAALDERARDLSDRAHRIARRTHAAVERADERLAVRADRLVRAGPAALQRANEQLEVARSQLSERHRRRMAAAVATTDVLAARVAAIDPAVQLARGWSITRRSDGTTVRSITDVALGERVVTTVSDGTFDSDVQSTLGSHPTPLPKDSHDD
ncbi:MAG: exodeoxyribonuclease VII large subunit [Acidimicrobiia bacterium]|nr:exodeoxyribonuclease VII large subunit [Acidimicrobiia bacterium]